MGVRHPHAGEQGKLPASHSGNTEVSTAQPRMVLSVLVKPLSNLFKNEMKQSVRKNTQAATTDSVEGSLRGKEVVFFMGTLGGG